MVTLQDISHRLIQPAKELADWSFPLSKILEMYLEELNNISFGEAALILQNSANVYVHRVQCLYEELSTLQMSFDEKEEQTKCLQNGKKKLPDLYSNDDFELIDFERDIGKNVNLKSPNETGKPIKLISRRFTQLESVGGTCPDLLIYDVHGEAIGRKYDFRCNQPVDINGTLVDEQSPADYQQTPRASIKRGRTLSLVSPDARTPRTRTSGYQSGTSPYDSITINNDSCKDYDIDAASSTQADNDDSFVDNANALMDTDITNESRDQNGYENINIILKNTLVSDKRKVIADFTHSTKDRTENEKSSDEGIEVDPEVFIETKVERQINRRKHCNPEDSVTTRRKRSERDKEKMLASPDFNANHWKSTLRVVNAKTRNSRRRKHVKHKRKTQSRMRKNEFLSESMFGKLDLSMWKSAYMPKSGFRPLDKDELEEFRSKFEECIDVSQKSHNYKAVMDDTMDLLGFRHSIRTSSNDTEDCSSDHSRNSSPVSDWVQADLSYGLPNYQLLIEDKMKDLLKECEITSKLRQTVTDWHRMLQPKLEEAERRTAFRIQDYTSHIVHTIRTLDGNRCDFSDVVRNRPVCELARCFLASLHLANTYKLEINAKSGPGMELSLLDDRSK